MASHTAFTGTEIHNQDGIYLVGNNITQGAGGLIVIGGSSKCSSLCTSYLF